MVAATETLAERLRRAAVTTGSSLCVGLDPDIAALGDAATMERWCAATVEATLPFAAAYKPNTAFYEQYGAAGWAVLERLRQRIPADRILLVDAKRGDIGSTAEAYARALLDVVDADAVTVNPLMGWDAVQPFLERPGRGVFLITRTSNPGAADLLEQPLSDGEPVFARITALARRWDPGGAVGLVVGATAPAAVAEVRAGAPELPLLLPGVGAQGGSLEAAVVAAADPGGGGFLLSVSRGIAGDPEGPAAAARRLHQRIEAALASRD